ncbi:polysaccharide pyruvyl transferase family protein [Chryseobacterium koreense]
MKAIIVPGVTDLNKGDQALVWESHHLAFDTGLFEQIFIVDSGETQKEKELLTSQSKQKGFSFIENILPHPRRGKHLEGYRRESYFEFARMVLNASMDFLKTWFLLQFCNNQKIVRLFYNKKITRTIKSFADSDVIFVKGGGFIHSYGELTAPYLMWYFLFYIRLALRLNKKVIFLPNSFGPFEGIFVKPQVKKVLRKVHLIYAREAISAKALSELLKKEVRVQNDLGFFLKESNSKVVEELLAKYRLNGKKIIGITVRPWRFPGLENADQLYLNYLQAIRALINHILKNHEFTIVLCNQSLGSNSHEDDRNAIQEIMHYFKNNKQVIWLNEDLPCDILKTLYSHFYFFIGTRFHSVIFSLTSQVPAIAIGYGGNKAKGIMGDFNLEEFVMQIEKVEAKALIEMFELAIISYDHTKMKLSIAIEKVDKNRSEMINDIIQVVS